VSEILTVHPKQYRDAQLIAENFRDGIPVIINLSQMSDADARRLIDFASGLSLGLYGRIERVTSKVFLLSPENVAISGDGTVAQADPSPRPSRSSRGVRAPGGIVVNVLLLSTPRPARAARSRVHPDVQP
jgi:FtsZ-interacting cell division protein YlmF